MENAKFIKSPLGHDVCIQIEIGGVIYFVPLDPANTDYQNLMKLVEEGKLVIQPADETVM